MVKEVNEKQLKTDCYSIKKGNAGLKGQGNTRVVGIFATPLKELHMKRRKSNMVVGSFLALHED